MKISLLLILIFSVNYLYSQTWVADDYGTIFNLKKLNQSTLSLNVTFSNGKTCKSSLKRISSNIIKGGNRKEFYSEIVEDTINCKPWHKVGIVWFSKPAKEDKLIADFGFVAFKDDLDETYDYQLYFFRKQY
jgi:hypothetical protein